MRFATVILIGGLGLATIAGAARAAPLAPDRAVTARPNIVEVAGGCGRGFHPVPGHWNRWRRWVPPHCVPNWQRYGGGYHPYGPYGYDHRPW